MLFLSRIPEILGWPIALMVVVAIPTAILLLLRSPSTERAAAVAALSVFVLYFLKFGAAPRVEVRFVLPAVPFLLIAIAASFSLRVPFRRPTSSIVAACIVYNVVASYWVGWRFANDPRMAAQAWMAAQLTPGSTIESTRYSPGWTHAGISATEIRMPNVSGRLRLFSEMFAEDSGLVRDVERREIDNTEWYSERSLEARRPDFLALNDIYYGRFFVNRGPELYPEMHAYFSQLLSGSLGYDIVWNQSSTRSPVWLYPRDIDFVDNRMVILKRSKPVEGSAARTNQALRSSSHP